jgi:hypothetical protein
MPRGWPPVSEVDQAYRAFKQRERELDELLHPPARKQRPEQRGAPLKLTLDEEKRGRDLVFDEKKNDPRLTMDRAEAMLKQSLKHADGSPIDVGRETWRSRVIRPAFKNARRK